MYRKHTISEIEFLVFRNDEMFDGIWQQGVNQTELNVTNTTK